MNIIFFDIDGVLNHQHSRGLVDWDIVDRVKQMAIDCKAKLVMSSSWKDALINPVLYNEPDKHFVNSIIDEFGDLFLGHTPDIDDDCREVEIQKWLDDHPNVDSFVILDDLDFGFPDVFPENFVKTTGFNKEGFSVENEREARTILR